MRLFTRIFLLSIFIVMGLALIFFQPLRSAVALTVIDDGLYYLKIAQNFSRLGFFTYDGITKTNGFHPLWQCVLLPVFMLIRDPWLALQAVYVLIFITGLCSILAFSLIAAHLRFSFPATFFSFFIVFANILSFILMYSMLETPIVLLAYVLFILCSLRCGAARFLDAKKAFVTGCLLGVAFLARTDSFLLALCYGAALIYTVVKERKGARVLLKSSCAAGGGALLLVLPYLFINYYRFGHLIPVSAWKKLAVVTTLKDAVLPLERLNNNIIPLLSYYLFGKPTGLVLVLCTTTLVLLAGCIMMALRNRQVFRSISLMGDFMAFAVIHFIFIYVTAPGEALFSLWYYTAEFLALGLVAGLVVTHARHAAVKKLAVISVAGLLIIQWVAVPLIVSRKAVTWARLELADYMREHLPQDARAIMFDSGIVSYFSQRDIVSANGLIGDFAMAELLRAGKVPEVIRRYRITYFIEDGHMPPAGGKKIFATARTHFLSPSGSTRPIVLWKLD